MFDYSLLHWTTFFTAVSLLILVPGPSILFVLGQSMKNGKKAGFVGMLGSCVGTAVHVVMAVLGLSAILATSAIAFTIVKWIGAIYLIWLGIKLLKAKGAGFNVNPVDEKPNQNKKEITKVFRDGFVISVFNPKTAIFFLAFLPQFIVEGMGALWAQSALHGMLFILNILIIEPVYIILGASLVTFLKNNKRIGLWMDRTIGAMFIALGVRLALIER